MMPDGPMLAHGTQWPAEHVCVVGQTVPHPPQLLESVAGSMHVAFAPAPHVC
jgi:hypothetical protein